MSLFKTAPWLEAEWGENEVGPSEVSRGSNYYANWKCRENHTWKALVKNRVRGAGCPYCAGKKPWPGFNDLLSQRPDLAREWSEENDKGPSEVAIGSKLKASWVGACGHRWVQPVDKRVKRGDGCPYCAKAGTKILPGFNDLATKYPEIAMEWSPKNEKSASEVFPASAKKFLWVGECGHEWESSIANRTQNKAGCPYCASNPRPLKGFNDLASKRPEIAKEWHPSKNEKGPEQYTAKSGHMAWWVCRSGHEWKASILSRVGVNGKKGAGCAKCSGRVAVPGETDLETLRPEIISEWDFNSNEGIAPSQVTQFSSKRVGWECARGHKWKAAVNDRTRLDGRETGCPRCAANTYVSRAEEELSKWVSEKTQVETSYRAIPNVHEVDIWCPSQKIGIEFNGLYWHSNAVRDNEYHYRKTEEMVRQGFQLIHVWEDDWRDRRKIVEKMIARKLGVSDEPRFNARSLQVTQLKAAQAREFLDSHHIQGFASGSWYGALKDGTGVRAVMVMKRRKNGDWELARYATSAIVRGGHSKLLKAFIREQDPQRIVTFADRGVSDGGLYRTCGFAVDGEISPDYTYLFKGSRVHKFNFRKARFRDDPNLKFEEGLTECQLAELNNLPRIYDAGKVRWVWTA